MLYNKLFPVLIFEVFLYLGIIVFSLYAIISETFLSRCGAQQSGDLGSSDEALNGILGFGKSNSSMLSQLASSGRVKKMFAHCLDGVNGGGIFAIGHVVQPLVNTTPLVSNQYVRFIAITYAFCL